MSIEAPDKDFFCIFQVIDGIVVVTPSNIKIRNLSADSIIVELQVGFLRIVGCVDLKR